MTTLLTVPIFRAQVEKGIYRRVIITYQEHVRSALQQCQEADLVMGGALGTLE